MTAVINTVLLGIVYFIAVGVTSAVSRLAKKEFLDIKESNKSSYWEDLNLDKKDMEEYYSQY